VFKRSDASAISSSSSRFNALANLSLCAPNPNLSAALLLPLPLIDAAFVITRPSPAPASNRCAYLAPSPSPSRLAPRRAHIFSRSSAAFLGSLDPAFPRAIPSSARVTRPFTSSRTPPPRLFTTRARASADSARARPRVDAGAVLSPLRLSLAARLASPRALAARRVFPFPSFSSSSSSSFARLARARGVVIVRVILARGVVIDADENDGRGVVATRIAPTTERPIER